MNNVKTNKTKQQKKKLTTVSVVDFMLTLGSHVLALTPILINVRDQ